MTQENNSKSFVMQDTSAPQTNSPLTRFWPLIVKFGSPDLLRKIEEWSRVDLYAEWISSKHIKHNAQEEEEENVKEEHPSDLHTTGQVGVDAQDVGGSDNIDKLLRSVSER